MSDIHRLIIGLNAVVLSIGESNSDKIGQIQLLCHAGQQGDVALPYGAFDPAKHRTFELGLRDLVGEQTQSSVTEMLGHVEQLYTFGDLGREAPAAKMTDTDEFDRIISVGYLALLTTPPNDTTNHGMIWRDWYDFFPWEDWRTDIGQKLIENTILPFLKNWANSQENAQRAADRVTSAFGIHGQGWEEERCLDRYELMYEAGLIQEYMRDHNTQPAAQLIDSQKQLGHMMASDHRRILATAMSRLRGKIRYRPIIFSMVPAEFTLLELQMTAESILGFHLHKQNFRRAIENSGMIEKTANTKHIGSGRPAAVFTAKPLLETQNEKDLNIQGLSLPRLRKNPAW